MPRRITRNKPMRNKSLDGLRAIAIVSVILYHLSVSWLPSGHMGVVLFLVLSGYLVSSNVLRTIRHEGSMSLPKSWGKRILRIWPAMAVMIAATVCLCVAFNHVLLTKLKPDLLPSLLLANNLGAILRGASYFDNLGGTPPLTHLWYLGVDFQFYVVWTAAASLLCPNGRSSRLGRRVALGLALVSAILMAVLFDPHADPTRVYYGPDTRAFAPLLGAWLGLAWPLGGRPVRLDRARHTMRSIPVGIVAPVALAGLVAIMVLVPDTSPFLYRGGMLLASILSVLVIAGALERRSIFSRILALPPVVWLGSRSYGLYLWHFPLFQLFKVTNHDTPPAMIALALALSLILAELSLRLVETPIAKGRLPLGLGSALVRDNSTYRYLAFVPTVVVALTVAIGATGLIVVSDETAVPEGAIKSTGVGAAEAADLTQGRTQADADDEAADVDDTDDEATSGKKSKDKEKDEDEKTPTQDLDNLPTGTITLTASKKTVDSGVYTPFIVADSVAGDADWCFNQHIPNGYLDSYIGRRPDQALEVLNDYLAQGVVGNIVILDSFSNVPATDDTMAALIEACGDRHVYLVNVRIPEVEQDQINDQISRFASSYDNVTLIDWYSYSDGHDDWIYPDGEHLTPEGQPYYVDMITNAIARDFAADGGTVTEG